MPPKNPSRYPPSRSVFQAMPPKNASRLPKNPSPPPESEEDRLVVDVVSVDEEVELLAEAMAPKKALRMPKNPPPPRGLEEDPSVKEVQEESEEEEVELLSEGMAQKKASRLPKKPPPPSEPEDDTSVEEVQEESEEEEVELLSEAMAPKKASGLPRKPPPPEPEEDPSFKEVQEESEEEEVEPEAEEENHVQEDDEGNTPPVQPSQVSKKTRLRKGKTPLPSAAEFDYEGSESGEGEGNEREESDYPLSTTASDFFIKPFSPKMPAAKDSEPGKKRLSETQKLDQKYSRSMKKAKANEEERKYERETRSTRRAKTNEEVKKDERDSRRRRRAKTNEEEKKYKSSSTVSATGAVGRVWKEEDEISLLRGMIDYRKEKGADSLSDILSFHDFIKRKLVADISKTQLSDKLRRLKNKFRTNIEKEENGEDLVFSKPHERKAFELAKRIWGNGADSSDSDDNANDKSNNEKVKRGGKIGSTSKEVEKRDVAPDDLLADIEIFPTMDVLKSAAEDFLSKYPNLSDSFSHSSFLFPDVMRSSLKEKLRLIGRAKAEELEKKWQELQEEEAVITLKKMNLVAEQTKLLLDANIVGNQ